MANLIRERQRLSPVLLYQNGWNNYISWKTWEFLILLSDTEWIQSFWLQKILLQSHTKPNFSCILWWTITWLISWALGEKLFLAQPSELRIIGMICLMTAATQNLKNNPEGCTFELKYECHRDSLQDVWSQKISFFQCPISYNCNCHNHPLAG